MPEPHDTEPSDAAETDVDWQVLDLLLDHNQRPWSINEVVRAYGHEQRALDGLERLRQDGLVHRTTDGFVFATRAAVRFSQLGS